MAEIDFWITAAWPDKDDRGRPVLRYVLEDAKDMSMELITPINSKLAVALRPDLEREGDSVDD